MFILFSSNRHEASITWFETIFRPIGKDAFEFISNRSRYTDVRWNRVYGFNCGESEWKRSGIRSGAMLLTRSRVGDRFSFCYSIEASFCRAGELADNWINGGKSLRRFTNFNCGAPKGEREGRCINSRDSNSKGVVPANKLYVARRREKLNHFGRNCCFVEWFSSTKCNIDRGTVRRFLFSKIKRNGGVFHFLFLYSRSFRLYKFV